MIVYTINIGAYDRPDAIGEVNNLSGTFRYICDNADIGMEAERNGWQAVILPPCQEEHRKLMSRLYKIMPQLLPVHIDPSKCSLYLDANYLYSVRTSLPLLANCQRDAEHDISVASHPHRQSVHAEQDIIVSLNLETKANIDLLRTNQIMSGFLDNVGLSQCNRILRLPMQHNIPMLKLGGTWWRCYLLARRDQASFDYVVWKHNVNLSRTIKNWWLSARPHRTHTCARTRNKCADRPPFDVGEMYSDVDVSGVSISSRAFEEIKLLSVDDHFACFWRVIVTSRASAIESVLNFVPYAMIILVVLPDSGLEEPRNLTNLLTNNIVEGVIVHSTELQDLVRSVKHFKGGCTLCHDPTHLPRAVTSTLEYLTHHPV